MRRGSVIALMGLIVLSTLAVRFGETPGDRGTIVGVAVVFALLTPVLSGRSRT